uniref:Uncharacterized protein n=1 Tax=Trypanosoma vivax (strain Y486) TaxID=1055687 RepID=G0UCV8_TRYVY|nr:hypothetical protein TVY486_1111520 [Trypanosoma vivax Y486]
MLFVLASPCHLRTCNLHSISAQASYFCDVHSRDAAHSQVTIYYTAHHLHADALVAPLFVTFVFLGSSARKRRLSSMYAADFSFTLSSCVFFIIIIIFCCFFPPAPQEKKRKKENNNNNNKGEK